MAEQVSKENQVIIHDFREEDFFEKYGLKKLKFLGKGMSGEVILVSQRSSFQLFAVKVFSLASDDKEKRMREFYREAQVMQTVSHRHLVPCLLAALCKGYTVITMPFYSGTDLCNLSDHGKLHPSVAGRYISQVAQAVEHLHKNNIVHNDIKLENIFLDEADQAILGDPGLALMSENNCETTTAGMVGGTKAYWPPERVMAARDDQLNPFKADVYAIGVVFWLLVSSDVPEKGKNYLHSALASTDVFLSFDHWMILKRLLEPNPAKRPAISEIVNMMQVV
ncbi:CBL-interacting serine/threonine-protein kinase 20 [Elysia marginata]|uniref:CBL-interacting serine/threonine-protein kinase 20 n=1 Tax=Elysia marginata TaxID=1093978 RepID=A0AAV4IYS1_9GAST|nr:CBL-interacting serine/threonine-protein kinase 20 [Elysia marginata]